MEPESGLREVVHQRVRLGVLAVLDRRGRSTFSQLRDALGQSDGSMSRHLGVLEEHGYIALEKVFENRRPRTWVSMTEAGAAALREEQELLSKLLTAAASTGGPEPNPRHGDRDDATIDITIAFAALLASDDEPPPGTAGVTEAVDHSTLVPPDPAAIHDHAGRLLGRGPISARYDFPPSHGEFGHEQAAQRLMMLSHGLRGGWITSWQTGPPATGHDAAGHGGASLTAHAMVVELGHPDDAAAILAAMGTPSLPLPEITDARSYLLNGPAAEPAKGTAAPEPAMAVAWFSVGAYLAAVVVTGSREPAAELLESLTSDLHRHLLDILDTHL
jgi:DNA-binding MarR family transcriptional regulator